MTPSAPASIDVAVRAFRHEHDYRHALFMAHRCTRCAVGKTCRTASMLADQADIAGMRWQEAERRLGRIGQ